MLNVFSQMKADFKEICAATANRQYNIMFSSSEFRGYRVFIDDDTCCLAGIPSRVPGACVCLDTHKEPMLVINTKMSEVDAVVLDTILLHEVGHIVNGDHKLISCWSFITNMRVGQKHECAADAYAISQGGDMVAALEMLSTFGFKVKSRLARARKLQAAR